jgi:hypothetical protein
MHPPFPPHAGGITFDKPGITMQSAPGEWAVIAAPVNSPVGHINAIQIRPGGDDGVLRNLEIVGGHYYGGWWLVLWLLAVALPDAGSPHRIAPMHDGRC